MTGSLDPVAGRRLATEPRKRVRCLKPGLTRAPPGGFGRLARSGGCGLIPCEPTLAAMDDSRPTTQYQIRVRGLLSERLLSAFPEMRARNRDHATVLTGELPDQSALHGVLGRIETLGLELLEVRRLRPGADAPHRTRSKYKADRTADAQ